MTPEQRRIVGLKRLTLFQKRQIELLKQDSLYWHRQLRQLERAYDQLKAEQIRKQHKRSLVTETQNILAHNPPQPETRPFTWEFTVPVPAPTLGPLDHVTDALDRLHIQMAAAQPPVR